MLVKLGDVWVDPASITALVGIRPTLAPDGPVCSVLVSIRDSSEVINIDGCSGKSVDDFAIIINDALAPKQSWSEEVSEPE